jgi:hypothetical protein
LLYGPKPFDHADNHDTINSRGRRRISATKPGCEMNTGHRNCCLTAVAGALFNFSCPKLFVKDNA